SARSRIAWAVGSSDETPCMNDFSSASPKVMVPRHRLETLRPLWPSWRYSIVGARLIDLVGERLAEVLVGSQPATGEQAKPDGRGRDHHPEHSVAGHDRDLARLQGSL